MVYILHGVFNTGARWERLAKLIGPNTTSVYCPDLPSIEDIARAVAPRIVGADTIIGHSTGGLVLYDMLMKGLIKRPTNVVFVATPFKGSTKLKQNKYLLFMAKFPKLMSLFNKTQDDISFRDANITNTDSSHSLLRQVIDYNMVLLPIEGSAVYMVEGERDDLVDRVAFPKAQQYLFQNCGHQLMLEDEERFVQLIHYIRGGR